jgi:hypothetical protein
LASAETAVVHLADHLVNAMQLGCSGERFVPPLNPRAWESLALPLESLAPLVAAIDDQTEAVTEAFLGSNKEEVCA